MSVTDQPVLAQVMQNHGVQTVFHAAAYKHVPLVEANPFQGLYNNVTGTLTAVKAAAQTGVIDFVLISTDKAVRPTNIMGASKRLAEFICQAHAETPNVMRVSMVRFGNVLSSSGSVIPRFKEQIAHGGPVTVTHPEITRFFMTIPEAVELVLQASGLAKGGEVFLLDMGEPVRIVDLAQRMIRLSGYRPHLPGADGQADAATRNQDHIIPIVFSGLRPGEKLYEELLIGAESESTEHPKIFRARERGVAWDVLSGELEKLQRAIDQQGIQAVHSVFSALGVDYTASESSRPGG
jgi:FlaA1/EpsC-like NDP-sugar epimerase